MASPFNHILAQRIPSFRSSGLLPDLIEHILSLVTSWREREKAFFYPEALDQYTLNDIPSPSSA
jgi:hypothetical protein